MGFLLPVSCAGCGAPGWVVCPACVAAMGPPSSGASPPAGFDSYHSLLAYAGPARALVQAVKYANNRAAVRWLAEGLAPRLPMVDLVTWAPTSPQRLRRRGYDQAELLARALARRLEVPARSLLRRRPGPAQTDLGRAGRLAHPGFDTRRRLGGRRVLVVDDVVTTGATLSAAAWALRAAGATQVHGAAMAAAPDQFAPGPPAVAHLPGGSGSRRRSGPGSAVLA